MKPSTKEQIKDFSGFPVVAVIILLVLIIFIFNGILNEKDAQLEQMAEGLYLPILEME